MVLAESKPRRVIVGAVAAALILGGNVLYVSHHLGFLHKAKKVLETDQFRYIEMAKGAEGRQELAREPPYCWRIAVPWLASRLSRVGVDLNLAFFLITNLALFGFLLTLYLYLAELGFDLRLRLLGLGLVGLMQGAVRWFEYQYWMSDPLCLFLVALAFLLVRRGCRLALAAVSLVAALVRETYVLVYPFDLLHGLRTKPPAQALRGTLLIAALPLALLVGLRMLIQPNQPDDMLASIQENLAFRARHLLDNQLYFPTVGTFGVLFPLLLLFPGRLLEDVRRHYDHAVYLVLVYASLAITNNTERPLAYALPVVLPAALRNLELLWRQARRWAPWLAGAALLLQVLFYARTRFAGLMGASLYQPTDLLVTSAMAVFWIGCRLALSRAQYPRTDGNASLR